MLQDAANPPWQKPFTNVSDSAYAEGDDFHPQANIDKMSAGIPLTDEDRWPWLKVINTWMVAREALDENTVVPAPP